MAAFAATTAAAPTNDAATYSPALLNTTVSLGDDPNDIPAWCKRFNGGWGFTWRYDVFVKGVDTEKWDDLCAALWREFKHHQFKCMVSNPYCGPAGNSQDGINHVLRWAFDVGLFCDAGCVASAFWGATKNKYGALDQRQCL